MNFVVIKYNRSKKLSIDFPGKGRFVLKNFEEYSSEQYFILRDRKVLNELINNYHCSIIKGKSPISSKKKKIDKKKKPVIPSNIVLEAPKDMTIAGQAAKNILVSYEGEEHLAAIQIVMQSNPDKEFILACYDKYWDLIRAKNIKVIHPMKIGQFEKDVDECFDLDELISYLDENKNGFDILDSINELLGLKPVKSYDFSFEIKPEEKEHSEIQARKLKNKKKKLLFFYPDINEKIDHEKICDIFRFLIQQGWTISVIGKSNSNPLPNNRLILDFRGQFKKHQICALAELVDAFLVFEENHIFDFVCNKNINKQFVFLLSGFYYAKSFIKHFKNSAHVSLANTYIKKDLERCVPCEGTMKECNQKYSCYKEIKPVYVATKFKNAYENIMNKKVDYDEPNFQKEKQ